MKKNNNKKKNVFMRPNGETISYNKGAGFHYEIMDDLEAGIELLGSEVKSLRINNPNFIDSYAAFIKNELFIKNFNIPLLKYSTIKTHEVEREKKLLLHKNEIIRLKNKLIKGLTIIPISVYFNKRGFVKVKIALAKGKKLFDKRKNLKEKDLARETGREMRSAFLK